MRKRIAEETADAHEHINSRTTQLFERNNFDPGDPPAFFLPNGAGTQERQGFGHIVAVTEVVRTSNAYRFLDPLDRMCGRKACKSENPTGPQNQDKNQEGARRDGARLIQGESPEAPPMPLDRPEDAPQREHGSVARAKLSPAERAAIVARMDAGTATKADWAAWSANLPV